MKATTWLCPVITLLCATRLVCTAQQRSSSYPLGNADTNLIQDDYLLEKRNKPSLSIVNPLDVLRQRLLLEIARRQMKENTRQVELNRAILKNVGKRMPPSDHYKIPLQLRYPYTYPYHYVAQQRLLPHYYPNQAVSTPAFSLFDFLQRPKYDYGVLNGKQRKPPLGISDSTANINTDTGAGIYADADDVAAAAAAAADANIDANNGPDFNAKTAKFRVNTSEISNEATQNKNKNTVGGNNSAGRRSNHSSGSGLRSGSGSGSGSVLGLSFGADLDDVSRTAEAAGAEPQTMNENNLMENGAIFSNDIGIDADADADADAGVLVADADDGDGNANYRLRYLYRLRKNHHYVKK